MPSASAGAHTGQARCRALCTRDCPHLQTEGRACGEWLDPGPQPWEVAPAGRDPPGQLTQGDWAPGGVRAMFVYNARWGGRSSLDNPRPGPFISLASRGCRRPLDLGCFCRWRARRPYLLIFFHCEKCPLVFCCCCFCLLHHFRGLFFLFLAELEVAPRALQARPLPCPWAASALLSTRTVSCRQLPPLSLAVWLC